MNTILPKNIKTVYEAKKFILTLHKNGESYHPEDPAEDIISHSTNKRKFTDEEAVKLNSLMNDIYNLEGNNYPNDMVFDPCEFLIKLLVKKTFLYKDKTGRGISSIMSMEDLLMLDEEDLEQDDDNKLTDWAYEAEEGDEWKSRTMKFICITKTSKK